MATIQTAQEISALRWVALSLTPSLGASRCRRLVEHFGNVENVFRASLTDIWPPEREP